MPKRFVFFLGNLVYFSKVVSKVMFERIRYDQSVSTVKRKTV